jgi:cellulose biosynthesis protein BcsQ
MENREMVRWLIGDEKTDIRYRLAHQLLSSTVLNNFDVILIDAPPRLTTASVQALCASTHVLIPTVLDPLSADDPVGYFGHQLKAHQELWPQLKVMGVIGTLTNLHQRAEEEPVLKAAGDRLRTALEGTNGRLRYTESTGTRFEFPYERSIRKSTPMARAAGCHMSRLATTTRDGWSGKCSTILARKWSGDGIFEGRRTPLHPRQLCQCLGGQQG